ncbi:hypothetical protein L2W58_08235 [Dethiosulfovibrio sp. F2B]|uniref:hypothetical protein n=1 Tax=Dethiosulfovibrio faecalis TaxID=2720018 RepID=UPI001F3DFA1D|nr:hypothetical protein [Dethiosulfovibrio faecalis]MCF4151790.1 hypothetical protein [Dethiosulfovibrio faecalis]
MIKLWFFKKKRPETVSIDFPDWEKEKNRRDTKLDKLKANFKEAQNTQEAIDSIRKAVFDFIENHNQSPVEMISLFDDLDLPIDITKRELAIRKEINRHYKQRENYKEKAFSIYLSLQHIELLYSNPAREWSNFMGLGKLQTNLKSLEYMDALIKIMSEGKRLFCNNKISTKLSNDIQKMFKLWNSLKIKREEYRLNLGLIPQERDLAKKHFLILPVVEYLDRRYKFNPQVRDELVHWCKEDIPTYEQVIKETNIIDDFSENDCYSLLDNPSLSEQKLRNFSIEDVKKMDDFFVPNLPSFDILWGIYEDEKNNDGLSMLKNIGEKIGYEEILTEEE